MKQWGQISLDLGENKLITDEATICLYFMAEIGGFQSRNSFKCYEADARAYLVNSVGGLFV